MQQTIASGFCVQALYFEEYHDNVENLISHFMACIEESSQWLHAQQSNRGTGTRQQPKGDKEGYSLAAYAYNMEACCADSMRASPHPCIIVGGDMLRIWQD